MGEITCARCGAASQALERPPLPGDTGLLVQRRVCRRCWTEWLGMQVRVINEYRLIPADPQHYEYLLNQMKAFLNIKDA